MIREGSGGPPRGLRGVGKPTRRSGRPLRRFERGPKSLLEVQEGSGGPPVDPEWVGRHSRRSEKNREVLLEVREGSGGPSRGPGGGREALPKVLEWLGGLPGGIEWPSRRFGRPSRRPPEGPGVVGRPSGRGRVALSKVWEALPEVREGSGGPPTDLGGPPEGPGGVGRPSWRAGRGSGGSPRGSKEVRSVF